MLRRENNFILLIYEAHLLGDIRKCLKLLDDSGNYFYSVSGPGTGVWIPFAVVDASALETTETTTVVEEPVAE